MTQTNAEWRALPHGAIERLAENLWRVEGSLQGMSLKRVMTLVRMTDGRLLIHSAIALREEAMRELEALGTPAVLVVPSGYHRLEAPAFKRRYPELRVVCPRGARARVAQVVPIDCDYDSFAGDASVRLEHLEGTREREGVMIVRSADGVSLVFNDVLFNMPHLPGAQGFVLRHVTKSSGGPRVSRIARMFLIDDKQALAGHLIRLAAASDLRRIVVSHHELITRDPARTLSAVAESL